MIAALAEFLLSRIAEDEAAARDAAFDDDRWRQSETDPLRVRTKLSHNTVARAEFDDHAAHITRWDPERVLAECEAKRRIIEIHYDRGEGRGCGRCATAAGGSDGFVWVEPDAWPCDTLRVLAAPYSDHPDYDPEWGSS